MVEFFFLKKINNYIKITTITIQIYGFFLKEQGGGLRKPFLY